MMTSIAKTTVIIPTFNRGPLLVETLESVLSQTREPDEIIVADDGSPDDTPERMAAYDGRIRYVRKDNSGKADTLNQIIPRAAGDLIWIVDDDDIVLPDALATLAGLLEADPEAGFAHGRYMRFTVDDTTGARRRYDGGHWRDVPSEAFLLATMQDFFVHHPGLIVRKSAYQAAGPFSLKYSRSEDYEMLMRLARKYRGVGTQNIVFLQRQHDDPRVGGLVGQDTRYARWQVEEQEMFTELRRVGTLRDYLVRGAVTGETLSPELKRQALITRGSVMARKALWHFAFEDFAAACAPDMPAGKLSAREIQAIREALFSKYGCPELLDDPAVEAGLLPLRGKGPVGAEMARTFARALAWFIRRALSEGRYADAARLSGLALKLAAPGLPAKAA
ncbi:MAG: glycosyltransferase family 2 protein [Hyphomonas sp.]